MPRRNTTPMQTPRGKAGPADRLPAKRNMSGAGDVMSGTWAVTGPGGPRPVCQPICEFVQDGGFFRGACEGPGAKGVAFGIVDGAMARWSYHWVSKEDGGLGAFEFVGQIAADGSISGVMMGMTQNAFGPFTARKMKTALIADWKTKPEEQKSPKLPPRLRAQMEAITPSIDGYLKYFPCLLRLSDGTEIDRVYVVSEIPYLRKWGVYPSRDSGKSEVRLKDVASIEESPARLPPDFANRLYKAGESGMGYAIFTVVFSDGTRLACQTGGAVDFIPYPENKGPKDVVAVEPHVGRGAGLQKGLRYHFCLFSE